MKFLPLTTTLLLFAISAGAQSSSLSNNSTKPGGKSPSTDGKSGRPDASLPPPDAEFYSSGKKQPLWQDRGWIAAKAADLSKLDAAVAALAALPEAGKDRKAEVHRATGLIVQPLHRPLDSVAYASLQQRAAAIEGVTRVLGTYINGSLLPIIEMEEICVQFPPGTDRAAAVALVEAHGAELLRPLGSYAPNSFLIRLRPEKKGGSLAVANALYESGKALFSHPDFLWQKQLRYKPNDPLYDEQQHLNNTGQSGGTAGADIRAERAWDITRGSSSVIIGVIDDSMDINHPDLKGTNHLTGHWDFRDNDADPSPIIQNGGFDAQNRRIWGDNHGTSVAGVIGALGNNSVGVSGVAPGCKMMGVRMTGAPVFDCNTPGTVQVEAAALAHAKNNGAAVINCSWGPADGIRVNGQPISQPIPDCVSAAINDAVNNGRGGKGCVICWAAGNGNEDVDLDGYASHPNVVCVAASSHLDVKASYSDFGDAIDVCAPGGELSTAPTRGIFTTDVRGTRGYRETSGTAGNYTNGSDLQGTSFATPVVAGVAALIITKEPNLTWSQVRERLRQTADFIDTANGNYDGNGHSQRYGYGRVNAHKALTAGDTAPPFVLYRNLTEGAVFTNLSAIEGETGDNGLGVWRIKTVLRDEATGKWWNWTAGGTGAWTGTVYVNAEHAKLTPPQSNVSWATALPPLTSGTYTIQVLAIDHADNESPWNSRTFTIDGTGPSMTTSQPVQSRNYSNPLTAMGEAFDNITEKQFSLWSVNAQQWYHWTAPGFTPGDFNGAHHIHRITNSDRAWSLALPVLPPGSYELHTTAQDSLGRWSGWQARGFRIDSLPTVQILSPANNSHVTDFDFILGAFTDPGSVGIAGNQVSFTLYNEGEYWNGSAWTAAQTTLHAPVIDEAWVYDGVPNLAGRVGTFAISAYIQNTLGETSVPVAGISNVIFRVDNSPPQTAVTLPAGGTVITTNDPLTFSGTASDGAGEIERVVLFIRRHSDNLYWNGSTWIENPLSANLLTSFNAASGTWTCTHPLPLPGSNALTQMTNGSYSFIALAFDKAGLTRQADSVVSVDFHQTYTWTGATLRDANPNNNSNFWGTPENWSPVGVPDAADIAVIANGDRVDSSISRTVYGMQLSSGMLNFINGPGALGTLTTTNLSTWTGGTMTGIWENQGTITVSGAGPKALWDDAVVNNLGTIIWNGSGDGPIQARAAGGAGAVINNKPGAVFRIAGAGQVFTREYGNRRPVFNNENGARLERDGSGGFATLTIWEFQNAGEIRAQTGILTFQDGPFDGYDLFLNPGTTLTGSAYLRINNATQLNTAVHAQCSVEMVDGSWLGCPDAPGVAKFEGTLNWWGGVIFGNLTIGSAGVLNATDIIPVTPVVKQLWDDTTLDNDGTINWTGGAPIRARAAGGAGAVINNRSGATFNVTADGTVFSREYGNRIPVFNNHGTFRKTAGAGTALVDTFHFYHNASMVCDAGVLAYNTELFATSGVPWTGAGDFAIQGGNTTVTGAIALNGPSLTITNAAIYGATNGSGAFSTTAGSTVEWKSGTFLNRLTLTDDSTLNLSGPDPKVLWDDAVLDNDGTITWQGGGPLQARNAGGAGAVVNNRSGARFEGAADGAIFAIEYGNRTPVFNNLAGATFARTAGGGTATVHSFHFNNDSIITAQTGVLAFNTVLNLRDGGTLNGAGRFEMPGGTVNVTGGTTLTGTSFSVLTGGIVGLAGAVWHSNSGGAWRWLGGTLFGTLELSAGSTMHIADPPAATAIKALWDDAVLNNRGTIEWSGASPIRGRAAGGSGCIIANKTGSVFRALSDGPLLTREYGNRMPRFIIESGAQWQKPSGDAAVLTTCDWSFENAGTMTLGGGAVDLLQGGDSSGTFTANGGGVLRFRGGTHTLRSGVVLSGNGRIQVDGGTVIGEGALLGNATAPGAFELLSGFLGGTVNYSGAGLFHWAGGSLAGVLTLAAGTRAEFDGPAVKHMWDDAVLNNSGTVTWLGSGAIQARAAGGAGAIINNRSGGIFKIAADGDVFSRESGNRRPIFYNLNGGRFEKSGGTGASTCSVWEFHSSGEMHCGTGMFSFVDGPYDGYDLFLEPGATLTGTGRLRLQTATHLTTAVHAQCPVDLPEPSWLGCPPPAEGNAPSRFEGLLNWTGGVIWGELVIGPAGIVQVSDAVPGTPVPKQLWDDTTLHNEGLIHWQGGAPIRARAAGGAGAVINNRGGALFHTSADGVVFAREYGNRTPVFNNLAGGTFRKTAGTGNTAVDTFAFNHRGGMVCDSGTVSFFTALDVASPTPWTGAGDFELHGGDVTIAGVMQLNGPSFTIRDGNVWGAVDGTGAFGTAAGGSIEWQGGNFLRMLRLTAGSTMNLSGPAVKVLWDDAVLDNDGSIIWHGGGQLRARAAGGAGAVLNNRSGATFHAASGGEVLTREYGNRVPVFNNAGSLRIGLPVAACSFNGWNLAQSDTGTLALDVAGPAAAQFDSLHVSGTATLAGTVNATKLNGYAPAAGTTFGFFTAGSVAGTFANVTGGFSSEYTATTVTLRAGAAAQTFDQWAASKGLTGPNALPAADPDKDGYSNFYEYVHNLNPAVAGGAPDTPGTESIGGQQWLTLKYRRYSDREAAGVVYTPETGTGLGAWTGAGVVDEVDPGAPVIPGSTACRCRVLIAPGSPKFLRIKAMKP